MPRYKRRPKITRPEETIYCYWDNKENDLVYHTPNGPDGHWIHGWMTYYTSLEGKSFMNEIKERGYDPTSIRITIDKDPTHPRWNKKDK